MIDDMLDMLCDWFYEMALWLIHHPVFILIIGLPLLFLGACIRIYKGRNGKK